MTLLARHSRSACEGAQGFIYIESCRVELEQLLKARIQYVFSLPVAIERCCGINANHAQNCHLTKSDPKTRVAIARFQSNFAQVSTSGSRQVFLKQIVQIFDALGSQFVRRRGP